MDFGTVIGMIVVALSLLLGIIASGLSFVDVISPASFFITVGGSLAALIISYPLNLTLNIRKVYSKILRIPDLRIEQKVLQIISFSEKARRDGLLALENDMSELEDRFLKKALQLVVDGADPEIVKNIMATDVEEMERRHANHRAWFETLGALAPAFGMLGTLLGLVGMLTNLGGDSASIGRGMATALITTLYGSIIANVFAIPVANKLRGQTEVEILIKRVMIEGILSIQSGDNPRIVQEKLVNYLPPDFRLNFDKKE